MPRPKKRMRSIKANAGIRVAYQKRLLEMIKDMHRSVLWWVRAEYRKKAPEIMQKPALAMDAENAPDALSIILSGLLEEWLDRWEYKLGSMPKSLIHQIGGRVRNSMKAAFLSDFGITIKMDPGRVYNQTVEALIKENAALIKSIPERYFSEIKGIVMRAVAMGRNIDYLEKELQKRYKILERRAKTIARDQVNKATQSIHLAESRELGITHGEWVHVPGTKSVRESHLHMDGKKFDLSKGLYDPDVKRYIMPGELVNCNCIYRDIIPEFED